MQRGHEFNAVFERAERVVDRVENLVRAAHVDEAGHWAETEHACRGNVDVLVPDLKQVATGFRFYRPRFLYQSVDAVDEEGEGFAHAAQNEFQVVVFVEYFAGEEAKDVEGDFAVPVEAMIREEVRHVGRVVAVEFGGWDLFGERLWCRVEVDGDIELLMGGKDGPEKFIVIEATIGCIVDQAAHKVQFGDASVELFDSFLRV